ncbi:MAG: hypothetical protein HYS43_00020 [Candidatus Liptonbacteria bacterium]|nr:hypothetical protein [Candidatus Liptonbacteria bacterium]
MGASLISAPFMDFPVTSFKNSRADSFRGHCFVRCDLKNLVLPPGVDLSGTMFVDCNLRGTRFPEDAIFDTKTRIIFGNKILVAGAVVPDHLHFAFCRAVEAELDEFLTYRRQRLRALRCILNLNVVIAVSPTTRRGIAQTELFPRANA